MGAGPQVPGPCKDETWSGLTPDGRVARYKVVGFSRDAVGRSTVEILRELRNAPTDSKDPKDPKGPRDARRWEETTITYTHKVGEVRRVVVTRASTGSALVTLESRLVESESTGLPELKKTPDPKKRGG